jgi:GNAT superfamily N-acetyltransferase
MIGPMTISYEWRGEFTSAEANRLHAECFGHAVILDTMVTGRVRRHGVGTRLVEVAVEQARAAGCEWLHVDFEDHLRGFYFDACGFTPTNAGLIEL